MEKREQTGGWKPLFLKAFQYAITLPPKKLLKVVFAAFCDCSHRLKKSLLPNQETQKQRASLDRIIEILFVFGALGNGPFAKPKNTKTTCLLRQDYRSFFGALVA